jgi:hypothetical protein
VTELDQIPATPAELLAQAGRKRLAPGEFVAGKAFLTDGTHHLGADAIVALAKGAGETTIFHEAFHTQDRNENACAGVEEKGDARRSSGSAR